MTEKYKYQYEIKKYSHNVRRFIIESNVKLNKGDIDDCINHVGLNKPKIYAGDNLKVSFEGTKYENNSPLEINEIKQAEFDS